MAFQSYIFQIAFGIGSLAAQMNLVMTGIGASARIFEILERVPAIPLEGGIWPTQCSGEVQFHDVSFSYPSRSDPVLTGFSLRIPPQSSAALVGASGSGKSTVVALLLRFYDVVQGRVTLDGHDLKELDPQWVHRNIGYVQVCCVCVLRRQFARTQHHAARTGAVRIDDTGECLLWSARRQRGDRRRDRGGVQEGERAGVYY
jgi:ABC-type multidrug transport system fused ATPase/permease subunit